MAYITSADYDMHIQDVALQQIINANTAVLTDAANLAQAEAKAYLIQKYDVDAEFAKTTAGRDPQLVSAIVNMMLYHLHQRISPRNIPELRVKNYMGTVDDRQAFASGVIYPIYSALGWLQACANGVITPKILPFDPATGKRIRYGGNAKQINSY